MSRVVNQFYDDNPSLEYGLWVAHKIGEQTFWKYFNGNEMRPVREAIDDEKYHLYHLFQRPLWKQSVTVENL